MILTPQERAPETGVVSTGHVQSALTVDLDGYTLPHYGKCATQKKTDLNCGPLQKRAFGDSVSDTVRLPAVAPPSGGSAMGESRERPPHAITKRPQKRWLRMSVPAGVWMESATCVVRLW